MDEVWSCTFQVMKTNDWAEVRSLAADMLGEMPSSPKSISILSSEERGETEIAAGDIFARCSSAALIWSLQCRAGCGRGGM